MKNILKLLSLTLLVGLAASCKEKKKSITNSTDYEMYLNNENYTVLAFYSQEARFWNTKFQAANNQWSYLTKMAAANQQLFENTGDVKKLYSAEDYLTQANKKSNLQNCGLLRSLAKNYITQHRFKEAKQLLMLADSIGQGKTATQKMLFDVAMELGEYELAENKLNDIRAEEFDYYIRLAKWQDYLGNLDAAITELEKATKKVELAKDSGRMLWAYSNLADFYGHAGRIEDAYQHYLKTLAIDPNYTYALKGIAWITFSFEKNTTEAKRIIYAIQQKHNAPDYHLLLADIAEFENNPATQKIQIEAYEKMLTEIDYGNMYNAYNIELWSKNQATTTKALATAQKEILNRATPQTYDLLSWAYLKNGDVVNALEISDEYVLGKTHEPLAAYHRAEILKANGRFEEVRILKTELLDASYELGPNLTAKIELL